MLAEELHIASDPELEADRFALLRERLREVGDGAAIRPPFHCIGRNRRNGWIGGGAIILTDVTIGDDCLFGAGSVVTRDVPPGATAWGNPADHTTRCSSASPGGEPAAVLRRQRETAVERAGGQPARCAASAPRWAARTAHRAGSSGSCTNTSSPAAASVPPRSASTSAA